MNPQTHSLFTKRHLKRILFERLQTSAYRSTNVDMCELYEFLTLYSWKIQ